MSGYQIPAVLTIAGSDSSGGAGIQADIKTIEALGLFAESAITALTAQNTTGVFGVHAVPPDFVAAQIDAVFEDIAPDAVKIGMVDSPAVIDAIAQRLAEWKPTHVVVDPVMVATSGSPLIEDEAVGRLVEHLFPLAEVITPNLPEAEVLSGMVIDSPAACEEAARIIAERVRPSEGRNVPAVLVKGGHGLGDAAEANDYLLLPSGEGVWLEGSRIDTDNTHGTGCTLSSAIACHLALGEPVERAVAQGKAYVAGALADGLDLGRGSGPLNHQWSQRR